MKKAALVTLAITASLLTACNQEEEQPSKNEMNHEQMGHGNMSHEQMHEQMTATLQNNEGTNELTFPKVLTPDHRDKDSITYTVKAQEGQTEIFNGIQTNTYGYNGNFLGPVLRVQKGMNVTINLVNDLQEDTTFHWHGLDVAANADGGPHAVLKSGETDKIEFTVKQEAATLWFHPHPMHETGKQVFNGLAGLLYIDDPKNDDLNLPQTYGEDDFPLILQDKTFTKDKQLDYAAVMNEDGTTGDTLLINGVVDAKLTVDRQKVRLRILNGSNIRPYKLHFDQDIAFEQIASDGGLLNAPHQTKEIDVSPSERMEVLVDFTQVKGNKVSLVDENGVVILPIHLKEETKRGANTVTTLNTLTIPEDVRNQEVTKKVKLEGMGRNVTINGQKFDMDRIDFRQKQNVTEVWEIENVKDMMGGMQHPFHIHGTQFQVISIDGKAPPAHLVGYKDTIALDPGQKAKIAVTFSNKGTYMFHCHILEHEDNGMMGQIEVY
ncbi:multicopper oxidase family protein [Bacillus sp. FJAT-42315]|uniref:multicopper oxidase family protein n=1 Tax=Bacillus sp. FJAT-42315 TaxID=2014077 RepID=UPI000C245F5C|nr:multicopper oxidase domain-containing protein [Bacillus sp. FJAT-42315]